MIIKKRSIFTFVAFIILALVGTLAAHQYQRDFFVTGTDGPYVDVRSYTDLATAVAAVGADVRTIKIFDSEAAGTLTIHANTTLEFIGDGGIVVATQLTLNTPNIIAPAHQIFSGAGDIDWGVDGAVVKSSWFSDLDEALDVTNDDTLTILITESETLTANAAVGNDVVLRWESEFLLTNGGFTVSNLKMIEAGTYQIFSSGAGDWDHLAGSVIKSSWHTNLRIAVAFTSDENVNLTILVDQPETVDSDMTVDVYQSLVIPKGNILTIETGDTITIEGSLESGIYQIFNPVGTGAVSFGASAVNEVYTSWFGFGPGASAANNTIYFHKAVASMAAGQVLIIPPGTHSVNNLIFNPPDSSGLIAHGILSSGVNAGPAFTIGEGTGSVRSSRYHIQNLQVVNSILSHAAGRIGVQLWNVYTSYIDIRRIYGFEQGIRLEGSGTSGCVYNEIHLGILQDNKYSIYLDASAIAADDGWTNENSFYGGRLTWTSAQDVGGWYHIFIEHFAAHPLNNNHFYNLSLEAHESTGTAAYGIYSNGTYSNFYSLRYELGPVNSECVGLDNPDDCCTGAGTGTCNILAYFTDQATDNTLFYGYGLTFTAWVTEHANTLRTKVFARGDTRIEGAVSGDNTLGVMVIRNMATEATSPGIIVEGIDGTANARIYGSGIIDLDTDAYYEVGGDKVLGKRNPDGYTAWVSVLESGGAIAGGPASWDIDTWTDDDTRKVLGRIVNVLRTHGLIQ